MSTNWTKGWTHTAIKELIYGSEMYKYAKVDQYNIPFSSCDYFHFLTMTGRTVASQNFVTFLHTNGHTMLKYIG